MQKLLENDHKEFFNIGKKFMTKDEAIKILDRRGCNHGWHRAFCDDCLIKLRQLLEQQSDKPQQRKVINSSAIYLNVDEIIVFRTCDHGEVFVDTFTLKDLRHY